MVPAPSVETCATVPQMSPTQELPPDGAGAGAQQRAGGAGGGAGGGAAGGAGGGGAQLGVARRQRWAERRARTGRGAARAGELRRGEGAGQGRAGGRGGGEAEQAGQGLAEGCGRPSVASCSRWWRGGGARREPPQTSAPRASPGCQENVNRWPASPCSCSLAGEKERLVLRPPPLTASVY